MPYQARAIAFTDVNTAELLDVELPDLQPDQVLLKAEMTGISPGTEMRVLAGKQEGFGGFPVVPGYTFVGRVVERGADVSVPVGTRVYCSGTKAVSIGRVWGGHISHAVTFDKELFVLPDSVSNEQAALITLASIAYHGAVMGEAKPHESVFVVGLGPIGQFSARLFALTGARVICADISSDRVAAMREIGLEAVDSSEGLDAAVRAVAPEGADIVVDATGFAPVAREAFGLLRDLPWDNDLHPKRRYIFQGSYPSDFALPYQSAFGAEAHIMVPRNHTRRDTLAVIDLFSRDKLNVDGLLSRIAEPAAAQEVYSSLVERTANLITAAFRWS